MKSAHHTQNCLAAFIVLSLISISLIQLVFPPPAKAIERPNIVIILADDLGYGDVSYQGAEYQTPHIDWIAKNGVSFTNFYTLPVCTQARVALLGGIFPHRVDLHNRVIKVNSFKAIPQGVELLSERFHSLNYQTAIVGKWHLGHHSDSVKPLARGFDMQYGNYCGFIEYFEHLYKGKPDLHRQGKLVREKGYATKLFAQEAVKFIQKRKRDAPLFLYLPFTAAHARLDAPKETIEKHKNIKEKKRRLFAAVVTELDAAIGRVIQALREENILDNTLIFFTSDNGANTRFGGDNGPFQSGKGDLHEGGIRVPAALYYPKYFSPSTKTDLIARMVDIMPTLYEITGEKAPEYADGRSLLSELASTSENLGTPKNLAYLLALSRTAIAARRGDWKIIEDKEKGVESLYHLGVDPGESINKRKQHEKLYTELALIANRQANGKFWKQEHPKAYRNQEEEEAE